MSLHRIHRFLARKFYLIRLKQSAGRGFISLGAGNNFNMPVRHEGHGALHIGDRNGFGFGLAPKLGSGEILLQPRASGARISIGHDNWFSNNVSLIAMGEITIGNHCRLGEQVTIYDCDFHEVSPEHRNRSCGPVRPVVIEDNVWIVSRSMILKGVVIGQNSVVAAMSVVTKSVPANCIVAGNPANLIRRLEGQSSD